ncbi:lachesin-like [Aphidius gifuensis]|uniref:lachesin-like n=1 Tax=Aphidius gifuensis TaxID=684658 RepID=UPI001CDBD71C|nr:lachesin-like [Aphidius gifuensis]
MKVSKSGRFKYNATLSKQDVPSFATPIGNVTIASGRETFLSCTIRSLSTYKVGWLRERDSMILSLGTRTVSNSQKFGVSLENARTRRNLTTGKNDEESTWKLHIKNVKITDAGCYMCQVNTVPMLKQLGCLDVLVAPDILSTGTSKSEVIVKEGDNATLECKASGKPDPVVSWRKEKNSILIRGHREQFIPVNTSVGERLELVKVDRKQMGAYLCIATNPVPPGVSKRVYLRIHFAPTASVENHMVGSPVGKNISLICEIEGYPKTINLWKRGEQVLSINSGGRYESYERVDPDEEWKTTIELKIRDLQISDMDEYKCIAKSSMGEAESAIRIYEIEGVTDSTLATTVSLKKLNFAHGNSLMMTTSRRISTRKSTTLFYQSTPIIPKNKKYKLTTTTTTTTIIPRVPLTKDHNAFKHNNVYSNAKINLNCSINILICQTFSSKISFA